MIIIFRTGPLAGRESPVRSLSIKSSPLLCLRTEQPFSSMDLTMLAIQTSCERDLEDAAALFHKADTRFTFGGG